MTASPARPDLGLVGESEYALEAHLITLDAWVVAAVKGEAWNGGDHARRPADVRKKTRTVSTIPRLPTRFRRHGGGRDHGGAPGAFGLP